ncbi:MAG: zinc-ribbon domain-containing protein, partial [Candidatus Omnitrophica bacterium]|nr:zinc-ribbon domain-containing protein [Candidatus Omnitrophota bacterium]
YRRVNPENNLRNNFPELCLEWSEKNYPLLPENFSRGSEYSAFWKCKRGHEWSARIDSRACGGNGCPVCAGKINEKVSDMEYAKEWSLNNLQNPEMISSTSHVKYLWYCLKHNFEFKASPNSRKFNKGGCPYCSGVLPEFKDSVASIRRFIELWDFTKNTLKPENLKAGSILKVWILNKFGKTEQVVVRDFIKRIKNGY